MSLKKADSATSQSDATVRTCIRSKSLPLCHAALFPSNKIIIVMILIIVIN